MTLVEMFRNRENIEINEEVMRPMYKWLTEDLKPNTIAIEIGPNAANSAIYLTRFEKIARIYIVGHDHNKAKRSIDSSLHGRKIENTAVGLRPESPTVLKHYLTHSSSYDWPIIMRCDLGGNEGKLFSNIESNDLRGVNKIMLSVYGTEKEIINILENADFKTEYKPLGGILSKRSGTVYAWR